MDKIPKASCKVCGGYHATSNVIHLEYVGHAALTDRLLNADPLWTWEPLALSPQGIPALDANGGLWIKLTVGGMTRLGYGDAQGKNGGDAIKECIGDALRNAAMRFGAALDLWHKGDLHVDEEPEPAKQAPQNPPQTACPQKAKELSEFDFDQLIVDITFLNTEAKLKECYKTSGGKLSPPQLKKFTEALAKQKAAILAATVQETFPGAEIVK